MQINKNIVTTPCAIVVPKIKPFMPTKQIMPNNILKIACEQPCMKLLMARTVYFSYLFAKLKNTVKKE